MTISVPSTDFHRQVGYFLEESRSEPIFITSHGRNKAVLMSAKDYERLVQQAAANQQAEPAPAAAE